MQGIFILHPGRLFHITIPLLGIYITRSLTFIRNTLTSNDNNWARWVEVWSDFSRVNKTPVVACFIWVQHYMSRCYIASFQTVLSSSAASWLKHNILYFLYLCLLKLNLGLNLRFNCGLNFTSLWVSTANCSQDVGRKHIHHSGCYREKGVKGEFTNNAWTYCFGHNRCNTVLTMYRIRMGWNLLSPQYLFSKKGIT